MARDYRQFWDSMTSTERIDWVDYHFTKYRKMGYDVSHFISLSDISDKEGNSITCNRSFFHEYKSIDAMEEYLTKKELKNEQTSK